MAENTSTGAGTTSEAQPRAAADAADGRCCVYDTAELRFVGAVGTKTQAKAVKTQLDKRKGVKAGRYEVRSV